MESRQGWLLRNHYSRRAGQPWAAPVTLSSVLIHAIEPSLGQSSSIATQVSDAARSIDMEARSPRAAAMSEGT